MAAKAKIDRRAYHTSPASVPSRRCLACGEYFEIPRYQQSKRVCNASCALRMAQESRRAGNRSAAYATRIATRTERARALGMTMRQYEDYMIQSYWDKVKDPDYYTGLRGSLSPGSALREV